MGLVCDVDAGMPSWKISNATLAALQKVSYTTDIQHADELNHESRPSQNIPCSQSPLYPGQRQYI